VSARLRSCRASARGNAQPPTDLAQIKSRARVRELAEVYTHEREVNAMLDLVPDSFTQIDTRFLEPACGSGNFLVAILARKLAQVSSRSYRAQGSYEHSLLRCVASIYGIDINAENIWEARDRVRHVVFEHYSLDANTLVPTNGFVSALDEILRTNITRADTMNHATDISFVEYTPGPRNTFVRTRSPLIEPGLTLFFSAPVPLPAVHYRALATRQTP
jgi:hypothetical protein